MHLSENVKCEPWIAIGPALGGLLAAPERGLPGCRLPILAAAAVAGIAALWSLFVVRETHPPGAALPLPRWGEALRFVGHHPPLKRLFVIPGAVSLTRTGLHRMQFA